MKRFVRSFSLHWRPVNSSTPADSAGGNHSSDMKAKLEQLFKRFSSAQCLRLEEHELAKAMKDIDPQYLESIELHLGRLQEVQVQVIGETSSGKTSFLNLMLGQRLFPEDFHANTLSFVNVRKGDVLKLFLNHKQDAIVEPGNPEEAASVVRERLQSLFKGRKHKIPESIDIYWPYETSLLQKGVVIVDTPGVGQEETIQEHLVEKLPKASAYIFIIDTSRAGGIKGQVEKLIEEQRRRSLEHSFSPAHGTNVILVCNMWDIAKQKFRNAETEKEGWRKILQEIPPQFTQEENCVVKFSERCATGSCTHTGPCDPELSVAKSRVDARFKRIIESSAADQADTSIPFLGWFSKELRQKMPSLKRDLNELKFQKELKLKKLGSQTIRVDLWDFFEKEAKTVAEKVIAYLKDSKDVCSDLEQSGSDTENEARRKIKLHVDAFENREKVFQTFREVMNEKFLATITMLTSGVEDEMTYPIRSLVVSPMPSVPRLAKVWSWTGPALEAIIPGLASRQVVSFLPGKGPGVLSILAAGAYLYRNRKRYLDGMRKAMLNALVSELNVEKYQKQVLAAYDQDYERNVSHICNVFARCIDKCKEEIDTLNVRLDEVEQAESELAPLLVESEKLLTEYAQISKSMFKFPDQKSKL